MTNQVVEKLCILVELVVETLKPYTLPCLPEGNKRV
jgi:hypothetical protein